MLSNHWRLAVRLFVEGSATGFDNLRSVQGPFEDQMHARALQKRQQVDWNYRSSVQRYVRTVVPNPTRPTPVVHEPEVDFHAAALLREVRRGLFACGNLRDVVLLAYGFECAPRRALFGPWGNVAHLTAVSRDALAAARRRSHRRQRDLAEYLETLYIAWRSRDDAALPTVERIARSCDQLVDEADRRFMRGIRTRGAIAA